MEPYLNNTAHNRPKQALQRGVTGHILGIASSSKSGRVHTPDATAMSSEATADETKCSTCKAPMSLQEAAEFDEPDISGPRDTGPCARPAPVLHENNILARIQFASTPLDSRGSRTSQYEVQLDAATHSRHPAA